MTRTRGLWTTTVQSLSEAHAALDRAGWRVAVVSGGTTKADILDALGAALRFPAHYGRNLDALWDCLTDLERPTALVWAGWEPLAVHEAEVWAAVNGVLRQRVDAEGLPAFGVVFCVGSAEEPGAQA